MSNIRKNGQLRWAPSFLRNRGQMTRAHKRAMRESWPQYGIRFQYDEIIDLDAYYDSGGPLLIEIGFGMGDHLIHLASALPDHRVLGIEVHRPGLAAAARKADQADLDNLRLIRGDARLVLTDHLRPHIARAIFIQFPDPWPKDGDEHRRLIQPGMIDVLHQTLVENGECLITTDVDAYAQHCLEVFGSSKEWLRQDHSPYHAHRIETLYEQKAIEAGRSITELSFITHN